jgi:hypothetical protein
MAVALPYSPVGHSEHTAAPPREYCPAGHTDAVGLTEPVGHAQPAAQSTHNTAPGPLHRPAGHTSPPGDDDVAPALHAYPALQLVHTVAPETEYVPGGHWAPAGDASVDPGGHRYPALHGPSQLGLVRPVPDPYRPMGQLLHAPAPSRLYCPGVQGTAEGDVDPAGQALPALQLPEQADDGRAEVAP